MLVGVLDQSPIAEGSTPAQALHNSLDLAELTDRLGYHRYWVAEHHATPALACAAPEILIGAIAPRTQRIRVGSGGVMLPHYSPLAGGWLSGGYRKGREIGGPVSAARRQRFAAAYDAGSEANAAKLEAADALGALADEAGITLVQMAIAFVTRHPAVTSAIVGPRTLEHLGSYLAADGVALSDDVLDRIDAIVPPGQTVNVADNMWATSTPALDAGFRRR